MKNLTALLLLIATFTACAAEGRHTYTCDNGSRLDITLAADADGRPQATLHFADQATILPLEPGASGTLYRQGDIRLHTRDDEALFEDGKGNQRRCRRGDAAPAARVASAASSSFIDISGTVTYLLRIALPPDAILTLHIRAGNRTLAEQRYELNGAQVPIPFSTTIDRDLIGKNAKVTVSARIEQRGRTRFVSDKPVPAFRNGQPVPVDIVLKPARPAAR